MLNKTPLTVFLSNLSAGLSRISKERNIPNTNGIKAGTFANYIAEASNFKNSNELSAKLDDYIVVHKSELTSCNGTDIKGKTLSVSEVQADFVSQWAEGIVRTDCILNLETLEITNIEVTDFGDEYEHLEKEYVSIQLNGKYYQFEIEDGDNYMPKICDESKAKFREFMKELTSILQLTVGKEYSHSELHSLSRITQFTIHSDDYRGIGENFIRMHDCDGNFIASFVYSSYNDRTGAFYKCIWAE